MMQFASCSANSNRSLAAAPRCWGRPTLALRARRCCALTQVLDAVLVLSFYASGVVASVLPCWGRRANSVVEALLRHRRTQQGVCWRARPASSVCSSALRSCYCCCLVCPDSVLLFSTLSRSTSASFQAMRGAARGGTCPCSYSWTRTRPPRASRTLGTFSECTGHEHGADQHSVDSIIGYCLLPSWRHIRRHKNKAILSSSCGTRASNPTLHRRLKFGLQAAGHAGRRRRTHRCHDRGARSVSPYSVFCISETEVCSVPCHAGRGTCGAATTRASTR